MSVITRFAPSPTGLLHIGNARTALINFLLAKSESGKFILRVDNTDGVRSDVKYEDAIKDDLKWLGLYWDEIFWQSERFAFYEAAKQRLIETGRLYPCYETQEELNIKKKSLLNQGLPPVYDRSALSLSENQKRELEKAGLRPYWRFLLKDEVIEWDDRIKGHMKFHTSNLSDPILIRTDGTMTYSLASVVDDIDMKITDVVRGEDHVSNSALHIQMFEALGANPPRFSHLALIASNHGNISKRIGGFEIQDLKKQGIDSMAINSLFATLGTSDPTLPTYEIDELIRRFDTKKLSKSKIVYDKSILEKLNIKMIRHMPYDYMLSQYQLHDITKDFWRTIRCNLSNVHEARGWHMICMQVIEPEVIDLDYTQKIAKLLPEEPWNDATWGSWIDLVKQKTQRKGKELFLPIRLALTGLKNGPELDLLLPLIGKSKVERRLRGIAA